VQPYVQVTMQIPQGTSALWTLNGLAGSIVRSCSLSNCCRRPSSNLFLSLKQLCLSHVHDSCTEFYHPCQAVKAVATTVHAHVYRAAVPVTGKGCQQDVR
jgi:hypothetical protein